MQRLDSERLVTSPGDLAGKSVAVHDHAALAGYLRAQLPRSKIVEVSSLIEGLSAVQGGQIDAMVGIALSVEYAVVNKNLRDLRVGLLPPVAVFRPGGRALRLAAACRNHE